MADNPGVISDRPARPTTSWRVVLDVAASVMIIAASMALLFGWSRRPVVGPSAGAARIEPPLPSKALSLDGVHVRGDKGARFAIIEYSDFECPFCAKFARETLPILLRDYVDPGRAIFAFRQFPLSAIHPDAVKAAEAAECADRQGRFWQMHDALFAVARHDVPTLKKAGSGIGLDSALFDACLGGATSASVVEQKRSAEQLQVSGTPTFFIGVMQPANMVKVVARLSGAQPPDEFAKVLDGLVPALILGRQ